MKPSKFYFVNFLFWNITWKFQFVRFGPKPLWSSEGLQGEQDKSGQTFYSSFFWTKKIFCNINWKK
jgi:hypothetical protein